MPTVSEIVQQQIARAEREDAVNSEGKVDEQARRQHVREFTLGFVRDNLGLDELPVSRPGDSLHCVLANALGGQWNGRDWCPTGNDQGFGESSIRIPIPAEVQEFIRRFDRGEYPDLVEAVAEGEAS